MKRNMLFQILYVLLLVMLPIASVLAEEGEGGGEGGAPSWFPMLEVGGVILGVIISGISFSVYQNMKGGMIGAGFGKIFMGVLAITVGIGLNGANEFLGLFSEFGAEFLFEVFIYMGLIMIGVGVTKVASIAG